MQLARTLLISSALTAVFAASVMPAVAGQLGSASNADAVFVPQSSDAAKAQTLFDQKKATLPAYFKQKAGFLRDLIGRYLNNETMSDSESEVAIDTLKAIGFGGGIADRNLLDGLSSGASKPAAPTPVRAHTHITTLVAKPVYATGEAHVSKHLSMAWVSISVQGRHPVKVFEVPGSEGLSALSRAKAIRARLAKLSGADPLWWMQLVTAHINGEDVVKVRDTSGFLVTADKPFAKQVGMSTSGLAAFVISRVKGAMDNRSASLMGGRSMEVTVNPRDAAIDLRQQGDDLAGSSPVGAEQKYRDAIKADPTYDVPYSRLIDLLTDHGKTADAAAVRQMAKDANVTLGG